MTDTPKADDYRSTVFLPKTGFPMKAGLAQKEPAILAKWAADDLYGRLRAARAGRERFILHDGPPYANGDIHMGHAMNKVLKDLVVRTQTLLGKDAPYVPGWDCHGLPIEWKVEEQYRARKLDKDQVDPVAFRAECRAYAAKWVDVQRTQFQRLGVTGDWDDPYLTMNYDAEAAIVAELLKFAETGQLYRGAKPVMWSPVEKTALAEAEVEYEDIVSTQIDVAFEIVEAPNAPELVGAHAVVWTTTPWTIPVNQAIAYGPEIEYVLVELDAGVMAERVGAIGAIDFHDHPKLVAIRGKKLIVARQLAEQLLDRIEQEIARHMSNGPARPVLTMDIGRTFKGADFAGTLARHPIYTLLRHPRESGDPSRASSSPAAAEMDPRPGEDDEERAGSDAAHDRALAFFARPRPFLPGDFVTTDAGTGLVHMAPDHGEDDFELCKAHGLDPVFAVEGDGRYRADWAWLGGQGSVIDPRFNAPDGPICTDLRDAGALLAASADYKHSYPHSWRSKAKLIFRATPQWFIAMDAPIEPVLDQPGPDGGGNPSGSSSVGRGRDASVEDSNAPTLRDLALDAIERTRWVPAKARNRIEAMVAGRPDWVISRQRAWGVPIALYVDRKSGDYLVDVQVNTRIVEAFRAGGADAWFTADHAAILGPGRDPAAYEPVTDILDVWFDSGSTHAFVIEARYGPDVRADLYVEGSDQHRGWFQSSLLESCGTRGRAPYAAVLTHGFALDAQGRKMSKSVGNVVDPLKVMETSGADILRLWVASTDTAEDVRIGQEMLATSGDAYRKLRNSFRYLLGALDGFSEDERVDSAAMPDLERYILARLAELDRDLRDAVQAFEFRRYVAALGAFVNADLSAFFFDIRKDRLYCDAPGDPRRRAYRTVLDILFHALVRYAAPILCFTAEEVWGTRFPDAGSVHLLDWPAVDPAWADDDLRMRWERLREIRARLTAEIEPLRRDKIVGSSLEVDVTLVAYSDEDEALLRAADIAELAIAAPVRIVRETFDPACGIGIEVAKTEYEKCGRCWRHLPEVAHDGALCDRCAGVVATLEPAHG